MKKSMISGLLVFWAAILLSGLPILKAVGASEPRITPNLLSPEKLELFAYEYPPLATMDMHSGGLYPEIVQAALKNKNIEAAITILPVRSLVKYNLMHDDAIAIIGEDWNFSDEERKQVIAIPFCTITGSYYYYRPAHKRELTWDGNLDNLKGYTYGAQKGEDVAAYKKAGILVTFGKIIPLFKKLKSRKIDFLSAPNISKEWIVGSYFSGEKNNFLSIKISYWDASSSVFFNKNNHEGEAVAKKFRQGLKKIMQDGSYIDILEKYFGKGNIPKGFIQKLTRYQIETEAHNIWGK